MSGEHAVGRVIARPFQGTQGAFERTEGRRDFALAPPARSYLQELQDAGVQVHGVGKIEDLFAGVGVSRATPARATRARSRAWRSCSRTWSGGTMVFANLIETDQRYGHRKDAAGFAGALGEIDSRLGEMLGRLRGGDLLIVTADHGWTHCTRAPTTPVSTRRCWR